MRFLNFDHVLLPIPPGGIESARRFYCEVLGFLEAPMPADVRAAGGLWLRHGPVNLHLGAEPGFTPSKRAHPAIVVEDFPALLKRLSAADHVVSVAAGPVARCHVVDPFGNRIEFIQAV